jgi:hypothetical protein
MITLVEGSKSRPVVSYRVWKDRDGAVLESGIEGIQSAFSFLHRHMVVCLRPWGAFGMVSDEWRGKCKEPLG